MGTRILNGLRAVLDEQRRVYRVTDSKFARAKRDLDFRSSCRRGCSHCCYKLAIIGLTEALLIADWLTTQREWRSWLPKLTAAADAFGRGDLSSYGHFERQLPCVFLEANQDCSIYRVRPTCCRYQEVRSAPVHCEFRPGLDQNIQGLYAAPFQLETTFFSQQVAEQVGLGSSTGAPYVGPIPLLVLHALALLLPEDEGVQGIVKELRDPRQWSYRHQRREAEEGRPQPRYLPILPIG